MLALLISFKAHASDTQTFFEPDKRNETTIKNFIVFDASTALAASTACSASEEELIKIHQEAASTIKVSDEHDSISTLTEYINKYHSYCEYVRDSLFLNLPSALVANNPGYPIMQYERSLLRSKIKTLYKEKALKTPAYSVSLIRTLQTLTACPQTAIVFYTIGDDDIKLKNLLKEQLPEATFNEDAVVSGRKLIMQSSHSLTTASEIAGAIKPGIALWKINYQSFLNNFMPIRIIKILPIGFFETTILIDSNRSHHLYFFPSEETQAKRIDDCTKVKIIRPNYFEITDFRKLQDFTVLSDLFVLPEIRPTDLI